MTLCLQSREFRTFVLACSILSLSQFSAHTSSGGDDFVLQVLAGEKYFLTPFSWMRGLIGLFGR